MLEKIEQRKIPKEFLLYLLIVKRKYIKLSIRQAPYVTSCQMGLRIVTRKISDSSLSFQTSNKLHPSYQ